MKLYKLTDENGQTRGKTQWGKNITHSGTGNGEMCGPGWVHAYEHPLLAVLFNPIHTEFANPQLWEAEGNIDKTDGLKIGSKSLTTIKRIDLPKITRVQRQAFAILVVKEFYKNGDWNIWADNWLSGKDRSQKAAETAAWAAARTAAAAWAAAWAAEAAARTAAEAAAWAARAAAEAAAAEAEAAAAEAAAAWAARTAAGTAAETAAWAAAEKIDFLKIAEYVIENF